MNETLLDKTLFLLAKDKRKNATLSRLANVGYYWLRKLRLGKIKNPGVLRLEQLYKVLADV